MGASTWVKSVQKSVKITSRKLMDTCHFRPFGRRGLDRARPWTTERIPRAYETRSETFRDTWVQVHGGKHVQKSVKICKITSRQRLPRVISGRLGNGDSTGRGLEGRKGSPVHTRHDPRRSETHGCKYMGETCSKVSENHIQTKMDTCPFRPFGRRGLGRTRPWRTERIRRAYETLSETFRDTWVPVHG